MLRTTTNQCRCVSSLAVLCVVLSTLPETLSANDWPQWRYDAGHTASAPASLPQQLAPQWSRSFGARIQVWDDPLNHDMMPYDRVFEPVVKDDRMFVTFNDTDKVLALDVASGAEIWRFYADGPIRFPAVAWQDRVIVCSDDGSLYCLDAASGKQLWRFRGAPGELRVIGNHRLISAWPARGGPVVYDDQVYFAASIWPFMGTFIYCLDAKTGDVVWLNDKTSHDYIQQPHSAPSFAGVAPQGTLVATEKYLVVPGGRSVPAVLDRKTGELVHFELNAGGKGNGGSLVFANESEFYLHTRVREIRAFDLATGVKTAFVTNEPVLAGEYLYAAELGKLTDNSTGKASSKNQPLVRAYSQPGKEVAWDIAADGTGDVIQAGDYLYAAGKDSITTIRLPQRNQPATVVGSIPVEGQVMRLLAASNRLFAVTLEGQILAFGAGGAVKEVATTSSDAILTPAGTQRAEQLLSHTPARSGYAIWYGSNDVAALNALAQLTEMRIVVVDPDPARVAALRHRYDDAGLYGLRVSVQQGHAQSFVTPPYMADLIVVEADVAAELQNDDKAWARIFESLRPYGGTMLIASQTDTAISPQALADAKLPRAEIATADDLLVVTRAGALEGAGDWTHQNGDIANTLKSNDHRVRLPLGLLWFGGSSNLDVLPRHGHGPPEQVIGGRLFIEGMNSINCRDVYTGRVLWIRQFPDLGTFDIYYDSSYKDTPLDTAYNQLHIPGANGRGTNFVATEEGVYLAVGNRCLVLDNATGETIREIALPPKREDPQRDWAFIGVYEDVLLAGDGFANFRDRHKISFDDEDKELKDSQTGFGSGSIDRSASAGLVGFDRHTGKVLWQLPAEFGFLHNGIVAGDGKVYCLDKLPKPIEDKLLRRGGVTPDNYRIIAIDAVKGEVVWEQRGGMFGTWLGYSTEHHLLLQAGASATDRLKSEVGSGMAVYRGDSGDVVWKVEKRDYAGPCILHHDTILTNANSYQLSSGAFSLLDGKPKTIANPLTGEEQTWQVCRAYGCNNIIASENLLTFRSGAAGFYDLTSMSGTGNLGGFKSGCTSNLIVANGVLNAPDYTRTCSCGYQNQTSLALVHMPDVELWTVNHIASLTEKGKQIDRIGLNFGAPGDRRHEAGTLWLEYPSTGGDTAQLAVELAGDSPAYFRRHSSQVTADDHQWVAASGVQNLHSLSIPLQVGEAEEPGIHVSVSHASDDAEEHADGSMDLTSSDLELVTDTDDQVIGIRFDNVPVPQGTKVRSAAIQFQCDETSDVATNLELYVEDSVAPSRYTDKRYNITSRELLPENIAWSPPAWNKEGEEGEAQRTPDVSPLVQEIIDRTDWKAGNPINFIVKGTGKRVATSFKSLNSPSARLVIDADVPKPNQEPAFPAKPFTVRLFFAEPTAANAGDRVFDVSMEGKTVLRDFDIVAEAGGAERMVVREFTGILLDDSLELEFHPKQGQPLICGVELVAE